MSFGSNGRSGRREPYLQGNLELFGGIGILVYHLIWLIVWVIKFVC